MIGRNRKGRKLRPLDMTLVDRYTMAELRAACQCELFTPSRTMDAPLLLEALRAMDDQPDEIAAPNQDAVWQRIQRRIRLTAPERRPVRRVAVLVTLLLLLAAAATGVAWAIKAGVLAFPSLALDGLPAAQSPAAQALVQTDLEQVRYAHCELRVQEAACDGHQLRIVYSLRDTRENARLSQKEKMDSTIQAAKLDGVGACDYLTLNGQDVFLEDTFQLAGETDDEMLYYLSANLPPDIPTDQPLRVEMPIGRLQGSGLPRKPENVVFTLDGTVSKPYALLAQAEPAQWGNTRVTLTRAAFSPLHGLICVTVAPIDPAQPMEDFTPTLFAPDGQPIQYEWVTAVHYLEGSGRELTIQYIPLVPWPDTLYLAKTKPDGTPDMARCLRLVVKNVNES